MPTPTDITPPLALSVDDAAQASGLSRSGIYEAMHQGLRSVKIGSRRLILHSDLLAWLESHRTVPS